MSNSIIVTLIEITDLGEHVIEIKPAVGRTYKKRFISRSGLDWYLEATRDYCNHKGYEFEFKDLN